MRKRSLTNTIWKKAFRACERSLIAAVNRRDKYCQLCGSKNVLQMDHAIISRKHKATFFEIRQMVLLCAACHCSKSFDNFGLAHRVCEIVRKREGSQFIKSLSEKSRQIKKWTITELENLTEYFENYAKTQA